VVAEIADADTNCHDERLSLVGRGVNGIV
jgi:hypothetical protein